MNKGREKRKVMLAEKNRFIYLQGEKQKKTGLNIEEGKRGNYEARKGKKESNAYWRNR